MEATLSVRSGAPGGHACERTAVPIGLMALAFRSGGTSGLGSGH
jgi:hypothetical protein